MIIICIYIKACLRYNSVENNLGFTEGIARIECFVSCSWFHSIADNAAVVASTYLSYATITQYHIPVAASDL